MILKGNYASDRCWQNGLLPKVPYACDDLERLLLLATAVWLKVN